MNSSILFYFKIPKHLFLIIPQASQTSNAKNSYIWRCGSSAMLRTSHTETNPGQQFFNCVIGACSFFK